MERIETDRLALRWWKPEDYSDLFEIVSDERVNPNTGTSVVTDIERCKRTIETYMKYNQSYAIVLKSENKVIGAIGWDKVSLDSTSNDFNQRYIGYSINPKYWGRGYALEAAQALIDYLLNIIRQISSGAVTMILMRSQKEL